MDTNSLIGTILTTAVIAAPNTGGIVAPPGASVDTGSSYSSVEITNTVNGDNSGGTSVTHVTTNNNGVVNSETKTERIPPGAVQKIRVANENAAGAVSTQIHDHIKKTVEQTQRNAEESAPVTAPENPESAVEPTTSETVTEPSVPTTPTVTPTVSMPAPSQVALLSDRIESVFREFFQKLFSLFHF